MHLHHLQQQLELQKSEVFPWGLYQNSGDIEIVHFIYFGPFMTLVKSFENKIKLKKYYHTSSYNNTNTTNMPTVTTTSTSITLTSTAAASTTTQYMISPTASSAANGTTTING